MKTRSVKRTSKLAVSLLYFFLLRLSGFVSQVVGRPRKEKLIILYYHGIPHEHRSNFIRQMRSLLRATQVWPAFYQGTLPLGKQSVAITFDDAYVSVAENALPELAACGFHATIFAPVGALGSKPTWMLEKGSPDSDEVVLSAERIATISTRLVTLGSHSITHPYLSRLNPDDARKEIEGSRHQLRNLTRQGIQVFAFPHGDHNASVLEVCKAAGYDYVFSITPRPVDTTSSAFVRGRVKVDPVDGPLEFFLKYNGAYSWIAHVSSLKRKLKSVLTFCILGNVLSIF